MGQVSSIPASVEAVESMMMYLVEAVSKDYNISMEAAKPKALELLYESSKTLLGSMPAAKTQSNTEFQVNLKALKDVTAQIQGSNDMSMIKILANRLEFHLGKLER